MKASTENASDVISIDSVDGLIRRFGRRLRVVVADCFYDSLEDETSQAFFGKLANFKIRSYLKDWPHGVMPFGDYDVVGTHFVLCEDKDGTLEPLVGVKMITEEQCSRFKLGFPALEIPSQAGATEALSGVRKAMTLARDQGKRVGYIGSWAAHPDLRGDKLFSRIVMKFSTLFVVKWYEAQRIGESIAFGVKRFKVDRFHTYFGWNQLAAGNGERLEFKGPESLFGESMFVSVFGADCPSAEARAAAAELESYWRDRLVIGPSVPGSEKKAA